MTKRSFGKVSDAFESENLRLEELILNRNGSLTMASAVKTIPRLLANSYEMFFKADRNRSRRWKCRRCL